MDEQKNGTAAPRRRRRPAVEPEVFEAVEQVRTSEQDVPPTLAKPSFKDVPVSHGKTKSPARMPKNGNTDGKKKKKKKKSGAGCLIALIIVLLLVVAALAVIVPSGNIPYSKIIEIKIARILFILHTSP